MRDLYRNEALTNIQDLRAEVNSKPYDPQEVKFIVETLCAAVNNYLRPIPKEDVQEAMSILKEYPSSGNEKIVCKLRECYGATITE